MIRGKYGTLPTYLFSTQLSHQQLRDEVRKRLRRARIDGALHLPQPPLDAAARVKPLRRRMQRGAESPRKYLEARRLHLGARRLADLPNQVRERSVTVTALEP